MINIKMEYAETENDIILKFVNAKYMLNINPRYEQFDFLFLWMLKVANPSNDCIERCLNLCKIELSQRECEPIELCKHPKDMTPKEIEEMLERVL